MTARQQVLDNPAPLAIHPPRRKGTNFVFDFATLPNQDYTVRANTNVVATNWVSYTNVTGDGFVQEITAPITNGTINFYRLSSP